MAVRLVPAEWQPEKSDVDLKALYDESKGPEGFAVWERQITKVHGLGPQAAVDIYKAMRSILECSDRPLDVRVKLWPTFVKCSSWGEMGIKQRAEVRMRDFDQLFKIEASRDKLQTKQGIKLTEQTRTYTTGTGGTGQRPPVRRPNVPAPIKVDSGALACNSPADNERDAEGPATPTSAQPNSAPSSPVERRGPTVAAQALHSMRASLRVLQGVAAGAKSMQAFDRDTAAAEQKKVTLQHKLLKLESSIIALGLEFCEPAEVAAHAFAPQE